MGNSFPLPLPFPRSLSLRNQKGSLGLGYKRIIINESTPFDLLCIFTIVKMSFLIQYNMRITGRRSNMEALNKNQSSNIQNNEHISRKSHVGDAANELLNESKKLASEIYEEGLNKIGEAEEQIKEYSELFIKKIQDKPLTSILIAGGIGFLLSKLLRK